MFNRRLAETDHLPLPVLPIGTEYPAGYLLATHQHRRAQLLYGARGVMRLETEEGSWVVPQDRAVMIPPETPHEVLMDGVVTWSLYIEPGAVPWWPSRCQVVEVDPLLRELLRAANGLPIPYGAHGRDSTLIALLLHELQAQTPLPFSLTVPDEEPFATLCLDYLKRPNLSVGNQAWATSARMSPRTFDRRFTAAAGISPAAWRSQARLLAALQMLGRNTVTETAASLGYQSPAAFTVAFTQAFGRPPSAFASKR